MPGRDKDYIRQPKANGYQSLHTVVIADDGIPMEVQVWQFSMEFLLQVANLRMHALLSRALDCMLNIEVH